MKRDVYLPNVVCPAVLHHSEGRDEYKSHPDHKPAHSVSPGWIRVIFIRDRGVLDAGENKQALKHT